MFRYSKYKYQLQQDFQLLQGSNCALLFSSNLHLNFIATKFRSIPKYFINQLNFLQIKQFRFFLIFICRNLYKFIIKILKQDLKFITNGKNNQLVSKNYQLDQKFNKQSHFLGSLCNNLLGLQDTSSSINTKERSLYYFLNYKFNLPIHIIQLLFDKRNNLYIYYRFMLEEI